MKTITTKQTLTIREQRHAERLRDVTRFTEQRDAAIDKLSKIAAKLKAARASLARYEKTMAATPAPKPPLPTGQPLDREQVEEITRLIGHAPVNPVKEDDTLAIPDFLRRAGSIGSMTPADLKAMAELEAINTAAKQAKARGRIAKMKAKQSGAMKAPALEGKAALQAIARGHR